MIKEIRYGGITTTPSDYECPDGDLRASYNLINEDGALTPVMPPAIVHANLQGKRLLCVHANTSPMYKHAILWDGNERKLSYVDYDEGESAPMNFSTLAEGESVVAIQPIGNTLVVCTETETRYYLWKQEGENGAYSDLGTMPELDIRFCNIDKGVEEYTKDIDDAFDIEASDIPYTYNIVEEDRGKVTNDVLSIANKAIAEATDDNLFVMPYFVRYAYRLYDGTVTRASAPVLMMPSTLTPFLVGIDLYDAGQNGTYTIYCRRYKLGYRCPQSQLVALKQWSDIIAGVDFYVSEPVWNYDQSGEIERIHTPSYYDNGDYVHFSNTVKQMRDDDAQNCTRYVELPQHEDSLAERMRQVQNYHLFKSVPLEDLNKETEDDIERQSGSILDYRYSTLEGNLSALNSRERLEDDYDSHDTITAASTYAFNARLSLANITKRLFNGFAPLCCFNAVDGVDALNPVARIYAKAFTFVHTDNGSKVVAKDLFYIYDFNFSDTQNEEALPRWYYYPNVQAFRTVWLTNSLSGTTYTVKVYDLTMRSHDFLNGSYYLALLQSEQPSPVLTTTTTSQTELSQWLENPKSIPGFSDAVSGFPDTIGDAVTTLPNKVYTSEVNNPFSFPLTGINTVGTGEILGLATATKALSEGQFGQFPLYAFTTDGVWALQTANNGAFIAVQPISRDVCVNADSITQTDNAVLFATDRGIMLLSGSQTACISESLEDDAAGISGMLGIDRLMNMCGITLDDTPFMQYIEGARMIYDYVNQRIVLYNPACQYSYVFSLKTKKWGMMAGQFLTHANAYPEVVVQDNDYNLVDLSPTTPQTGTVKGLLITRPLKLDGADVLKTVNTVLQRGYFDIHAVDRRPIQQVIWGSRDLLRWHLLSTSNEWYMRGFRGTPYKYFVIGIALDLARNEKLMGATIQHEPRYINHPR